MFSVAVNDEISEKAAQGETKRAVGHNAQLVWESTKHFDFNYFETPKSC
jgi:hypothetical protein